MGEWGDVGARNLRIIRHEAETPMRGHDADGTCCIRAAVGALTADEDRPKVTTPETGVQRGREAHRASGGQIQQMTDPYGKDFK